MYNVVLNLNKIFIIMRNVKMKRKHFASGEETPNPVRYWFI